MPPVLWHHFKFRFTLDLTAVFIKSAVKEVNGWNLDSVAINIIRQSITLAWIAISSDIAPCGNLEIQRNPPTLFKHILMTQSHLKFQSLSPPFAENQRGCQHYIFFLNKAKRDECFIFPALPLPHRASLLNPPAG